MNAEMAKFVVSYIDKINNAYSSFRSCPESDKNLREDELFDVIVETCNVFCDEIKDLQAIPILSQGTGDRDANAVLGKLRLYLIKSGYSEPTQNKGNANSSLIFISHSGKDKKYGNAIAEYLLGIGIKKEQLIYTSHASYKVPEGKNIFDYLRKHISTQLFMIILWSESYLESSACMNELGAAWVVRCDYSNIFLPKFDFHNPRFTDCAIDTKQMGIDLGSQSMYYQGLIELKDRLSTRFTLETDEKNTVQQLRQFSKKIEEAAKP